MIPKLSEAEIARAKDLLAEGKSYRSIGKELNRSPNSIKAVAKNPKNQTEIAKRRAQLADEFEDIAHRANGHITEEKLSRCSAPQLAMVSGVCTDKANTLRGKNSSAPIVSIRINNPTLPIREIDVTEACGEE